MLDNILGFHIEPTNICTLKCPGCSRTQFINQWPQHWKNLNLDLDQLLKFFDIDLSGRTITFCGNIGDPIYHPDILDFVKEFKKKQTQIKIVTNGSYKTEKWWQELVECLDQQDNIIFSIDGLPDNFVQYRVNADWSSIQTALEVCGQAGCFTTWKYIPFNFNQDDIYQASDLAKKYNIKKFLVAPSDRFDQYTEHLKPNNNLIGHKYESKILWKKKLFSDSLEPKCHSGAEHYISASGHYSPCCYIGDYRFYHKTQFGKNQNFYSIEKHTLSQILEDSKTQDFFQNLNQHKVCQFNCASTCS